jgi:hypothetical protein
MVSLILGSRRDDNFDFEARCRELGTEAIKQMNLITEPAQ